jgi:hypothetical protein
MQHYAMGCLYSFLDEGDHLINLGGSCSSNVDYEIGVYWRDFCAANSVAF